jgi:putative ATP-dependent endonuclease of OLD family
MLLSYFERRVAERKTAGELLLVEEPEAHLHPQLQRVLLATLQRKNVQVFITTHSTHVTSGLPLSSQIVLTTDGGPVTQCAKPSAIPNLNARDAADLERYLDATRSVLLYARKVLLVEGPAEQFVIPPLAKAVLGIDLDEQGIAVVPIFGTHFASYAKLFGSGGMQKKCAILTDGDLTPSDADPSVQGEEGEAEPVPRLADLEALRGPYVEIFSCETTFERELTLPGTLEAFEAAVIEIGVPGAVARIMRARTKIAAGQVVNLNQTKESVLRAAKRFGKARFAQVVSKHVTNATEMPNYIESALNWLLEDAVN